MKLLRYRCGDTASVEQSSIDIEGQNDFGHSGKLQLHWMCGENERKCNTARDVGDAMSRAGNLGDIRGDCFISSQKMLEKG